MASVQLFAASARQLFGASARLCSVALLLALLPAAAGIGFSPSAIGAEAVPSKVDNVRFHRGSEFLERKVVNAQLRPMGEIVDVVLDIEAGVARYVAVSLPALADPDRAYVFSLEKIGIPSGKDYAVLDIDAGRLRMTPHFSSNDWPGMHDPEYWSGLQRSLPGLPIQPKLLIRMSRLIGKQVRNLKDEEIGSVRDVVLSGDRVHYAVLEFDTGLLSPDKLFAYPLSSFAIPGDARTEAGRAEHVILDVSRIELERLRGFGRGNWPDVDVGAVTR